MDDGCANDNAGGFLMLLTVVPNTTYYFAVGAFVPGKQPTFRLKLGVSAAPPRWGSLPAYCASAPSQPVVHGLVDAAHFSASACACDSTRVRACACASFCGDAGDAPTACPLSVAHACPCIAAACDSAGAVSCQLLQPAIPAAHKPTAASSQAGQRHVG